MITHRVLALPILFVGKSISDVIYPQVVSLIREGKSAHALIRRWTVIAALVASPIAVVLLMGGPSIFAWVLGEEWREAGSLAQAMVPWMVGALVSRPAVGAVAAMALQRAYLFYDAIAVAARSLSFLFMLLGGFDVWVCLLTWSIISVLGALWIVRLTLARARVS
jgi:O-antigen/teichoic acid export membrane protein